MCSAATTFIVNTRDKTDSQNVKRGNIVVSFSLNSAKAPIYTLNTLHSNSTEREKYPSSDSFHFSISDLLFGQV